MAVRKMGNHRGCPYSFKRSGIRYLFFVFALCARLFALCDFSIVEDRIVKVSYYPGCALHGTALEYDESTRAMSGLLGVELCELPDWNCCGASSAHVTDESLAFSLVARNLAIAQKQGMDVVVPCAACYSRFKAGRKRRPPMRGPGKEAQLPDPEPPGIPRRFRASWKRSRR